MRGSYLCRAANFPNDKFLLIIRLSSLHQCHFYFAIVAAVVWAVRISIQLRGAGLDLLGRLGTNAIYDLILAGLWMCSASMQSSSDISDPQHLSLRPWYLERGCDGVWRDYLRACRVVKACFGVTVFAV